MTLTQQTDILRLWTLQPPEVLDTIEKRGRFTATWSRLNLPEFEPTYRWMARQMVRRGVVDRARPPIWAWHSINGANRRPDMRRMRDDRRPITLITLRVPSHLALLMDFDDWHHVLNEGYLSWNERQHLRIERLEAQSRLTHSMIEESWQRVFDWRSPKRDPDWCGDPARSNIQACLPHLDREWIVKVEQFHRKVNA